MAPAVLIGGQAIDTSAPLPKNVKLFDNPTANKDLAYGAGAPAGPYKEVGRSPKDYKKSTEEEGTIVWPAASYPHYLPTYELTGPAENGGV